MIQQIALKQSPLDDLHHRLGAKLVSFAGWSLPLQFAGIIEEHNAVRNSVGVFDISHMGRFFVTGPDASRLVRRAVTYNVCRLQAGQAHYAAMCQEDGGIIDDVFVYCLALDRLLVVGNAVNADTDRDQVASLMGPGMQATIEDVQSSTAMIAVQGPGSEDLLTSTIAGAVVRTLPHHGCMDFELLGAPAVIAQSGYTGENGYEVIVEAGRARAFWQRLLAARAQPCGLGARDTLRLEAALMLYGNDIDRTTNPFEAGLGWLVELGDEPFVGREALRRLKERGVARQLVCLKAADRGIMRSGFPVLHDGQAVGRVTSGGFSPTLGISIGMAYVPPQLAAVGTALSVDVRGRPLPVTVVRRPFYKRPA